MASRRSGKKAVSVLSLTVLVLGLAAVTAGIFLLVSRQDREQSRIEVMEQRLRDMRRLKTVSRTYRSVIFVEEKKFLAGRKQVLFSLEYEVSAGVDFSRGLDIEPLSGGVYRVSMPASEVFDSDAVESSIRQMILMEGSVFNKVNMGDYMPQIVAQGQANRQAAVEDGILDRAEINAREAVTKVLRLGGIEDVVFAVPERTGGDDG